MRTKLLLNLVFIGGLLGLAFILKAYLYPKNAAIGQEFQGFAHVIDGDSLRVEGIEVRIWGIDAPELAQKCQKNGQEIKCGRDAARYMASLISGRIVKCAVKDIDIYERKVSKCSVDTMDLGQAMILAGQAISFGGYRKEEAEARTSKKGIWFTTFETPKEFRAQKALQQNF